MLESGLVEKINALHGTDFRADARFEGGEQGAVRLVDGRGRRYVLKGPTPTPASEIAATTAVLAAVGYPAPRYVLFGEGYSVQEELAGAPLRKFSEGMMSASPFRARVLDQLLELNELQAGRAVIGPHDWPRLLVRSVLEGEQAYMVLESLRAHSDASRALLARCQEVVRRHAGASTTTDDVVHWDFHPENILATADRVTAVIDWDATTSGDRLFDLATLLYFTPNCRRVRDYVVERVGEGVLSAYLAHMCVREADWCIRLCDAATAERALAYALVVADAFDIGNK